MLVFMVHVYHDEFRAPGEALGCPRSACNGRFSAGENLGSEAAGKGDEPAQHAF